jgi:hypothetical protein
MAPVISGNGFMRLACLSAFAGIAVLSLPLLSGCGSEPQPKPLSIKRAPQEHVPEWRPVNALLLRYDANKDGNVTRAEMEAGLKADFDAADTNHDGVLDKAEVEAVNHSRWDKDASASSPLIDWNNDGVVDLREYSATVHSLFDELDKDGDGVVTREEMKLGGGPKSGGGPKGRKMQGPRGGGGGEPPSSD